MLAVHPQLMTPSVSLSLYLALWLSLSLWLSLCFCSLALWLVQLILAYMAWRNLPEVNSFLVVSNSRPHYPVPVFAPAYMTDESESGQMKKAKVVPTTHSPALLLYV